MPVRAGARLSWRWADCSWDWGWAERRPRGLSCGRGTRALHLSLPWNLVLGGVCLLREWGPWPPAGSRSAAPRPAPRAPTPWKAACLFLLALWFPPLSGR